MQAVSRGGGRVQAAEKPPFASSAVHPFPEKEVRPYTGKPGLDAGHSSHGDLGEPRSPHPSATLRERCSRIASVAPRRPRAALAETGRGRERRADAFKESENFRVRDDRTCARKVIRLLEPTKDENEGSTPRLSASLARAHSWKANGCSVIGICPSFGPLRKRRVLPEAYSVMSTKGRKHAPFLDCCGRLPVAVYSSLSRSSPPS